MKQTILAVTVVIAMMLCSCEGDKPAEPDSEATELLLYCGAGIRPPVDELVEIFGRERNVKIIIDYAGSEVLLSKIKLTRRGDLYMPGDKHYVDPDSMQIFEPIDFDGGVVSEIQGNSYYEYYGGEWCDAHGMKAFKEPKIIQRDNKQFFTPIWKTET